MHFDYTTKWDIHKPESIQENEKHNILCDIMMQKDSLIPARILVLVIIKKTKKKKKKKNRTRCILDFAVSTDHRMKLKKSEKKNKYLYLAEEQKKLWNMWLRVIPIVLSAFRTNPSGLESMLAE